MPSGSNALEELLTRTVGGLGYELADFEYSNRNMLLQVFIDKIDQVSGGPDGRIGVADCQRVSDQLQRVLPVEGVNYERLEVSSPGLDRRLRKSRDFERFAGYEAAVRFRAPVNGRTKLVGILGAVVGEQVEIDADGVRFVTDVGNIERARLVPKI